MHTCIRNDHQCVFPYCQYFYLRYPFGVTPASRTRRADLKSLSEGNSTRFVRLRKPKQAVMSSTSQVVSLGLGQLGQSSTFWPERLRTEYKILLSESNPLQSTDVKMSRTNQRPCPSHSAGQIESLWDPLLFMNKSLSENRHDARPRKVRNVTGDQEHLSQLGTPPLSLCQALQGVTVADSD